MYHILLVDDYEINLELLETYLQRSRLPLKIYRALNGRQALHIAETKRLDLILLDVMLPDINGYDICKKLKNDPRWQAVPIIMITALDDRDSLFEGLQSGADEFLTKPVDGHELNIRVRNLLKLRQLTADLHKRNQQLENELQLAGILQQTFLPDKLPEIIGCQVEVLYQPSVYIGGDFYAFLPLSDGRWGIFIADVKGHGAASAMLTATLKDNLDKLSYYWVEPAKLLTTLNKQLYQFFGHIRDDFFIMATYVIVDGVKGWISYASAGQCPPVLVDKNTMTPLDSAGGLPLGVFGQSAYENQTLVFPSGAELFLYTDGIFSLPLFDGPHRQAVTLVDLYPQGILMGEGLAKLKQEIRYAACQSGDLLDDINYISVQRTY